MLFERRLCRRNLFLGGGFGRGAEPPSEFPSSLSEKAYVRNAVRAPALPAQPVLGGRFGRGAEPPSEFPSSLSEKAYVRNAVRAPALPAQPVLGGRFGRG